MAETAVTKQSVIGDILRINIGVAPILMKAGFHCLGCPSAQGETLEEAGYVHGIEVDELVDEINAFLAAEQQA